jgi:Holliday junction DNA helicase RuvA
MIARIYGQIDGFSNRGVYVRVGGIVYEVLLTVSERQEIEQLPIGKEISFHTLYLMEGGVGSGSQSPVLVGFQNMRDRQFFEIFIGVEGIGIGSALKILAAPVPRIAQAIEDNNLAFLCTLKQVGDRTARKIVASLMGKVGRYTLEETELQEAVNNKAKTIADTTLESQKEMENKGLVDSSQPSLEQLKLQATEVLEQLGYSTTEVKKMLTRAFASREQFFGVEEILNEIYQGQNRTDIRL